jgi:methionyl aminopeptidase
VHTIEFIDNPHIGSYFVLNYFHYLPLSVKMAIGCTGCGQPMVTTMGCPTCQKLGLVPALFCSQECFKASWAEHKKVHKAAKKLAKESESGGGAVTCTAADEGGNATGNKSGNNSNVQLKDGQSVASSVDGWKENPCMDRSNFIGYEFTGTLRPFPFAKKQRACPSADVPDLPDYAINGTPQMERMQNRLGRKMLPD